MTYVLRKNYGQVTYSMQKQAYVLIENDAKVPIENSMYIIYHEPTKSFKYDQKMKQMKQISVYQMRLLLCQDAIFLRIKKHL